MLAAWFHNGQHVDMRADSARYVDHRLLLQLAKQVEARNASQLLSGFHLGAVQCVLGVHLGPVQCLLRIHLGAVHCLRQRQFARRALLGGG